MLQLTNKTFKLSEIYETAVGTSVAYKSKKINNI